MANEGGTGTASSDAGKGAEGKPAAGTTGAGTTGAGADGKPAGGDAGKGTEGKAGATGSGTTGDGDGGKPAVKNAPEKYALKLAEGSRLSADEVKQLEADARAADWTNDQAAAVLAEYENRANGIANGFLEKSKADKTYGGDSFSETERLANLAIDKLRPAGHARRAEFMDVIDRTGYGRNIAVLSFLADLGKLFAEDSPEGGNRTGSGAKAPTDHAAKLYDGNAAKKTK